MNVNQEEFEKIAHAVAKMVTERYATSIDDAHEKKYISSITNFYTEAYIVAKMQAQSCYVKLSNEQAKDDVAVFPEDEPLKSSFRG